VEGANLHKGRNSLATWLYRPNFPGYDCRQISCDHGSAAADSTVAKWIKGAVVYGINTNEWLEAEEAATKIATRARAIRADPPAFSKYTVRFVRALDEQWPELRQRRRGETKLRESALR
jgi:hypothetical protein